MSKTIYFTSDLHLGHDGIMKFGQRKHDNTEDMAISIVEAWNAKVRKHSDIVYILGDVCFKMAHLRWLNYLNGELRLVLGNHDCFDYNVYRKRFSKVYHFHQAYKGMVLTHVPIHPNELEYRNWRWNVHGHIHDPAKNIDDPRYFNVNMDVIGYAPISLEEIREQLNARAA